jgi:hypothetical protein
MSEKEHFCGALFIEGKDGLAKGELWDPLNSVCLNITKHFSRSSKGTDGR